MPDIIKTADDLRARIRDLAAIEPDPAVVSERILGSLGAAEYRVVAITTLHDYVRRVMAHPAGAMVDPQPSQSPETPNERRPNGGSWKVQGIRDWVARELLKSVFVGDDAEDRYKHLKDCTADDCLNAAAIRRQKAEQTIGEAERFEACAKAVKDNGVTWVGELDRSVLEGLLRR